jgi:hypothetical protein
MKNLLFLLIVTCLATLTAHAQETAIEKAGKDAAAQVQKLTKSDTTKADTTVKKQNGIVKEIKKDVKALKDKTVNTGDQVKSNVRSTTNALRKKQETPKVKDKETLKAEGAQKAEAVVEESVAGTGIREVEKVDDDLKNEGNKVKDDALREAEALKGSKPDSTDLKKLSQDMHRKLLDEKMSQMQYSSDDPENAPWKKKMFSKDDLKDLGDLKAPSLSKDGLPSADGKVDAYEDKLKNVKAPGGPDGKIPDVKEQVGRKLKPGKLSNLQDSISGLSNKIDSDNLKQSLLGAKKIYSDKYIKKIYDSLGVGKADSILKVASAFAKTETPKEELLNRINSSISGKSVQGASYDAEKGIGMKDADKLNTIEKDFAATDISSLKKGNISDLKLPESVLSELPPLSGMALDSKYLPLIDSMREVTLKAKGYLMEDEKITEDLKRSALKKKPSFLDKSYFEGIIGFFSGDSAVNVFQASPSFGYHFTDFLSVGLGPSFLVQFREKKLNMETGFRSFVKGEVWKQRAYLQVEDNVKPSKLDREISKNKIIHEVLAGGGALLPISKSIGINFQVLYRLNKLVGNPDRSPWVFRVGLSSMKKPKK